MVAGLRGPGDRDFAFLVERFWPPTGAMMIGESYFTPRISVLMSTLLTSTRRRGRSLELPEALAIGAQA